MKLRLWLPFLLVGVTLALPAAPAMAGSYTAEGCSGGNYFGWNFASAQVRGLPTNSGDGGRPHVSHNDPPNGSSGSSSTWTTSPAALGKMRFRNAGEYGPWNTENSSANWNSLVNPWGNMPTFDSGYHFLLRYQNCSSTDGSGFSGRIARTGNVDPQGNHIYAVGPGSFLVLDYNTDGAPVNSYGGRVLTYSAAEYCWHFKTDCVSDKRAIKGYQLSDLYWKAGVFRGGVKANGFDGDGSSVYTGGSGNDPSGKTNGKYDPSPVAQTMNPGGSTNLRLQISCGATGGCVNSSHQDRSGSPGAYLRAYVVASPVNGSMPMTLGDNYAGSAGVTVPSGWVRGTRTVTASGDDGQQGASGIVKVGVRVAATVGSFTQDGSAGNFNLPGAVSCADGRRDCTRSESFSVNTASLSNGSVSVYGRTHDDAGNGWVESAATTMYVDNQDPGPGPGGACSSGLSATAPSGNTDSNGRKWIRGEVEVVARGCDGVSGIDSGWVEYQTLAPGSYSLGILNWGSSWSKMSDFTAANPRNCSTSVDTPGGQNSTINCRFNSAALPEGTAIRFRWSGQDQARTADASQGGNAASSAASSVVYADNTAPVASNLRWEAYNDKTSSWDSVTTGWTNGKKTRLRFNALSPGNGSPLEGYFYLYESDPNGQAEGTTSGSCAAQQPDGWKEINGVTTSEAFVENRSEQCRQGTHQVWMWVKDVAGNGADNNSKDAAAGTSTVKYDSVPTPESRDESWAKSDTLMPQSFKAFPTAMGLAGLGKWTTDNNFTASWTNPAITNDKTQAPIIKALYQVGAGNTLAASVADIQEYTGCLVAGQACSLSGLKAPSEGSHPVRMWLQDAAGNSSLEQSAVSEINWRDGTCVQP